MYISGPPTATDIRDVQLSAQEREFLAFLLYQWGTEYIDETADQWADDLSDKLQ